MKYYIKGDFYFDIDDKNQLRITGPENHLLCGIAFPNTKIHIDEYDEKDGQLEIKVHLFTNTFETHFPLVTDVRTFRNYTESAPSHPLFSELQEIDDLKPEKVESEENNHTLRFITTYENEKGEKNTYGSEFILQENAKVVLNKGKLKIESEKSIKIIIKTISNIRTSEKVSVSTFVKETILPSHLLSPYIIDLFEEAGEQISYLVRTKRTSSFEYGTIFPRDWIESADLGIGDLSEETIDYMYKESMKFISETGEGWHENIVGHYETRKKKIEDEPSLIDRKMIDIEPHYILGMERLSKNFLSLEKNQETLRLVASYVLENARNTSLITFKKLADPDEYYNVGNWRDSTLAFPRTKSPIAPYDVNCVFYPESLRIIKKYWQFFKLNNEQRKELDDLIAKWNRNKDKFKLYHDDNLLGYSIALYGKKHIPLPIPHLDESYDLFYSSPSMEEIVSFAKKIIDPDYFYTPAGPSLVTNDEESLTTKNYHGKVIWPKQAAFSVAGLYKHYQIGLTAGWPENVIDIIREAILVTCRACFKGWLDLGAVPELYYYDWDLHKARFYTDQEEYEGQMSLIQLWSSVGMRTITRIYVAMMS